MAFFTSFLYLAPCVCPCADFVLGVIRFGVPLYHACHHNVMFLHLWGSPLMTCPQTARRTPMSPAMMIPRRSSALILPSRTLSRKSWYVPLAGLASAHTSPCVLCPQVMSRRAKGPGFEERLSFDAIAGDLVPPRKLCDERWYVSYHDFVRMAVEEYGTQRMLRWQRAWKFWEVRALLTCSL